MPGLETFAHVKFTCGCQRFSTSRPFRVTGTRIYRFQLTSSGQISGYSSVPGGDLGAVAVSQMAATQDGGQLAVNTNPGSGTHKASIQIINTRTGARAV